MMFCESTGRFSLTAAEKSQIDYIAIAGPTGVGKSRCALDLARRYPSRFEIVSVDSVQVFHGCDIGSAKPSLLEQTEVKHHLIDICDVTQRYTAAAFVKDACTAIESIRSRGKIALITGGTFLYLQAFVEGLSPVPAVSDMALCDYQTMFSHDIEKAYAFLQSVDPLSASRIAANDTSRIERAVQVYLSTKKPMSFWRAQPRTIAHAYRGLRTVILPTCRKTLKAKLAVRFDRMLDAGLVDEVTKLRQFWPTLTTEMPSMRAIGYRQVMAYLDGACDAALMRHDAIVATHRYLKRQLTWLRTMQGITQTYQGEDAWRDAFLS